MLAEEATTKTKWVVEEKPMVTNMMVAQKKTLMVEIPVVAEAMAVVERVATRF
jgi:hypothetical protein